VSARPSDPATIRFGGWQLQLSPWSGVGLVVAGVVQVPEHGPRLAAPADYVSEILLTSEHRDQTFALIDQVGLLVCKGVHGEDAQHREVRGRSSRGRLSQGEFFHHDGCAGPQKPRIVEIRCPYQEVARSIATAIAPFPEVVHAMLCELPSSVCAGELGALRTAILAGAACDWDAVQGTVNRAVRRGLSAEDQRAYLRQVDVRVGAYREPWEMGESRFIANENPVRTMQHRRAYLEVPGSRANGKLVKRWPAEQLAAQLDDEAGATDDDEVDVAPGCAARHS
jgi:hypothetical protein